MKNYYDQQEEKEKVFERLSDLGFTTFQIETIGNWWNLYTSNEHYQWFMNATRQEIEEASAPAFDDNEE